MNIPVGQGRTFGEEDNDPKAPLRYVINEAMARQMYPNSGQSARGWLS
jgi:hypothetical protein